MPPDPINCRRAHLSAAVHLMLGPRAGRRRVAQLLLQVPDPPLRALPRRARVVEVAAQLLGGHLRRCQVPRLVFDL